jgi:hypothetical protein
VKKKQKTLINSVVREFLGGPLTLPSVLTHSNSFIAGPYPIQKQVCKLFKGWVALQQVGPGVCNCTMEWSLTAAHHVG